MSKTTLTLIERLRSAARIDRTAAEEIDPEHYTPDDPVDIVAGLVFYAEMMEEAAAALEALAASTASDKQEAVVDDLRMLVQRLVHALNKASPDNDLGAKALDYLVRKGLTGSILRDDKSAESGKQEAKPLTDHEMEMLWHRAPGSRNDMRSIIAFGRLVEAHYTTPLANPSDKGAEPVAIPVPTVIDRSHPNQAYVTYGFRDETMCTEFINATNSHTKPLYAAPHPAAQDDARDAERYRWLRSAPFNAAMPVMFDYDGPTPNPGWRRASVLLDNAIDAAIAKEKQG